MKIFFLFTMILSTVLPAQSAKVSVEILTALPSVQGQSPLELKDARYIVLDFWASWCSPCEATFPFLKEQSRLWKDKKVLWLGINTDSDLQDAQKFLKKFESDFLHLHDPDRKFSSSLDVDSLPRLFVLDSEMQVVYAVRGFNPEKKKQIERKFKELFSKP